MIITPEDDKTLDEKAKSVSSTVTSSTITTTTTTSATTGPKPTTGNQHVIAAPAVIAGPDDPPPEYTPLSSQQTEEVAPMTKNPPSSPRRSSHASNIRPTNFVSISRSNDSIRGTWLLDPFLSIPQAFLPPLAVGETEDIRKNLSLVSSNGAIQADVTLAATASDERKAKLNRQNVTIYAKTSNGSITMKLHAPTKSQLPLRIDCYSSNGAITLYVPRDFNGLLSLRTKNGSVKLSDAISSHIMTFSDVSGMRRSFLGDYAGSSFSSEPNGVWSGDEIVAETRNGSIRLFFDDEVVENDRRVSGFFTKLFGL